MTVQGRVRASRYFVFRKDTLTSNKGEGGALPVCGKIHCTLVRQASFLVCAINLDNKGKNEFELAPQ